MTSYVALLRAVNVGGTGKMPMQDLVAMCEKLGFTKVKTYIASGNVMFQSRKTEKAVHAALAAAMEAYAGKPVGVMVRTPEELRQAIADNPFPKAAPNRTVVIFLDGAPPSDALRAVTGQVDEEIALGKREIYVSYGTNMAHSKLKIPAAKTGTARNMNTVAKLAELAAAL